MSKEDIQKAIKNTIIKNKEIVFGVDSPICIKCLDELKKQHVVNDKAYNHKLKDAAVRKLVWDKLHKNIVMDDDMMTDMRKHKVLRPEVDYTHWKEKFKSIFFSIWVFFHEHSLFTGQQGKGGGYLFNSSLPIPQSS